MSTNRATASATETGDVMAAVEGSPRTLIIADVSRDEAWLSMPLDDAVAVPELI